MQSRLTSFPFLDVDATAAFPAEAKRRANSVCIMFLRLYGDICWNKSLLYRAQAFQDYFRTAVMACGFEVTTMTFQNIYNKGYYVWKHKLIRFH